MLCIGDADVDLSTEILNILPFQDPLPVSLTLTRDSIAQEVDETFTLTIVPITILEGYTANRLVLQGTILDADSKLMLRSRPIPSLGS